MACGSFLHAGHVAKKLQKTRRVLRPFNAGAARAAKEKKKI